MELCWESLLGVKFATTKSLGKPKSQDFGLKDKQVEVAGNVCHRTDGRGGASWSGDRESVGRPAVRWTDYLKKVAGSSWMRKPEDRVWWHALGKAYVQQWTLVGY
ncbi:jg21063 [Pararge aegeria aegeria]|uniref:Jg21063 protein n=1 Tax=Pararge aegeria aegeria TaxID=348720 RepID=A0A8S4RYF9_9NEOP|nr:jg21063 [Pararge aegeria aegeria]